MSICYDDFNKGVTEEGGGGGFTREEPWGGVRREDWGLNCQERETKDHISIVIGPFVSFLYLF